MSSRRKQKERRDVLGGIGEPSSLQGSTDEIYRPSDDEDARPMELRTGRIVAKPVDIMTIWADIIQPRRAVPLAVRGQWDGNPEEVVKLLYAWREIAETAIQQEINVKGILKGRGDGIDYTDADGKELPLPPVTKSFVKLLQLGASILKDRLINPITISPRGDIYLIETGERRWLAHHLLAQFVSKDYLKISATEVQRDVWRQATENNNRDPLTAIQMARQLALLVMDMYQGDDGVKFDPIHHLVEPGGCDRRYYAQVANGNVWKIKPGFSERIQAAMGLSSYRMVSAYRKLLRYTEDDELNDEIWMKADLEGWTEFAIRTYFDELNKPDEPEVDENTLPVGKVTGGEKPVDKSQWASFQWVGKEAWAGPTKVFVVECNTPDSVGVEFMKDGEKKKQWLHINSLSATQGDGSDNADTPKPETPQVYRDKNGVVIESGDTVMTRRGAEAVVTGFNGRYVEVTSKNQFVAKGHYPEWLEVVPKKAQETPQKNRFEIEREDWTNKPVRYNTNGHVGIVVEDRPAGGPSASVQWSDGQRTATAKMYMTIISDEEYQREVTKQKPAPEKSVYPDDLDALKGRRVGYKGDAAIIVAKSGEGKVYIQWGKERLDVAVDELDFDYPPAMESKPAPGADTPQLKGLVLAEDDVMRRYLEPYRMLSIVLDNEHATNAIEWLMNLTYERTNRKQLEAAMNHVIDHVEEINKTVEAIVFEQFRLKLDELN